MLAAVAAFALPGVSSAAVVINQVTLNGGANAVVPMGDTAQANVNYTITGNSHVQSVYWQVVDSAHNGQIPFVCVPVAPHLVDGTYNASFPVGTGGLSEGGWTIKAGTFGDPGTGIDTQCTTADQNGSFFYGSDILQVTSPTDSNTSLGNPFPGDPHSFCALFPADCTSGTTGFTDNTGFNFGFGQTGASLTVFCQLHPNLCGIAPVVTPPPPQATSSTDAKLDKISDALDKIAGILTAPTGGQGGSCAALTAALVGTMPGTYSQQNSNLQVFLMSQGFHITNSGQSTSFFGPLTQGALNSFKLAHGCN